MNAHWIPTNHSSGSVYLGFRVYDVFLLRFLSVVVVQLTETGEICLSFAAANVIRDC